MRRIAELDAMLMIWERGLALAALKRHFVLWEYVPEGYRRAIEEFAQHQTMPRLVPSAEAGLDLWLALRESMRRRTKRRRKRW